MINLKLEKFEGPFDLLYHLIEENEIDIYDIPIAIITQQYLEYIENADMNDMSEFLVMAAKLLQIKSKMLLPIEEEESEDPREDLVKKLIEYKKIKQTVKFLEEKETEAQLRIYKENTYEPDEEKKESMDEVLEDINMENLYKTFKNLVVRNEERKDKLRADFGEIKKDIYTLKDQIKYLESRIKKEDKFTFSSLFRDDFSKIKAVVTFLAMLELIKNKIIEAKQTENFKDILIIRCGESNG